MAKQETKKGVIGRHWNLSEESKKHISDGMKLLRKTTPPANKTHGLTHTRIHRIWKGMKTRCENKNSKDYKNYGGRSISIKWENFDSFYRDMSETYSDNLQIDRIDVNKSYSRDNCRWITSKEQQNNRRNNKKYSFMGICDTVTNWAKFFGFNKNTLKSRLCEYKWDIKKALTTNNPYYE